MSRQKKAHIQSVNAARAAHWLQEGGFTWWRHVARVSKLGDASEEVCENTNTSKPRGLRVNRKTLAAAKHSPEWSDYSSDEDT
jgi:hypothetical protein